MSDERHLIVHGHMSKLDACHAIENLASDKRWSVKIEEYDEHRTVQQNRLLWGVIYRQIVQHIADSTGQTFSDRELHAFFTDKFLFTKMRRRKLGKKRVAIYLYKSSSELGKKAFSEYVERIAEYCASELGLTLSMPEDRRLEAMRELP